MWVRAGGFSVRRPDFKRIALATRIYRTDEELDPHQGVALHTVTTCDPAAAELDCSSTAVLGAAGRVFYVGEVGVRVGRPDGGTYSAHAMHGLDLMP